MARPRSIDEKQVLEGAMAIQKGTQIRAAKCNTGYPAGALITRMTVAAGRIHQFDRRQIFAQAIAALSNLTVHSKFAGIVNAVARYERLAVLLPNECRGGRL